MNNKTTVLYVDDESINLQLFKANFKNKFNVLIADSGNKGLDVLIENQSIKIVISDMRMPGMNGIEFIKRAKMKFPRITFFILTGYEITDEIQAALDTGLINKYFSKPFKMVEIDMAISDALIIER
jgi:response regulator RpfG family c-di-GMP phosphodiesterase